MNASPRTRPRRRDASSRPLFEADRPGRDESGPATHDPPTVEPTIKAPEQLVAAGALSPESRWQYLGDAA